MRDGMLNEIGDKAARQYCDEIVAVLKKLEQVQPGSGLPSRGGNFSCKVKALEVCVLAISEFLIDEHFTVTVQLHDKVEFTGKTWIET